MIDLFPAIDLRGGRCVRLYQGDYDQETVYGDDPVAVAIGFADAGARWVHIVDLDAARGDGPRNRPAIAEVAQALAKRGVAVQTGGGVRDVAAVDELLAAGVRRVVIGTAAFADPDLVGRAAANHPGGVAVGLDARGGQVAVQGWTEASGVGVLDAVARFSDEGVAAFVVTDIARDGTLAGPDIDGLASVCAATDVDVVASGGVGSLDDLRALARLPLAGVIVGKAIYEGRVEVADALGVLTEAAGS